MVRPIGSNPADQPQGRKSEGRKEISRRMLANAGLAGQAALGHFFNPHAVAFKSLEGRVSKKPPSDGSEGIFNKSAGGKKKHRKQ